MSPIVTVIIAVVCLAAGCAGGFAVFRYILTGKYKDTMEKAEKAADVIKEKKLLEVKEKFLNKKSELEKEVQQRTLKIQQGESRLKQREVALNQRQEEINRRFRSNSRILRRCRSRNVRSSKNSPASVRKRQRSGW